MQEFSCWLTQLPAAWDKNLMNCTPADVIAFLESHWLDTHAGTQMPDGSLISSPSGLNQCLSSLTTGLALLGRVASWTPELPSGNPIQSSLISSHRKGYRCRCGAQDTLKVQLCPSAVTNLNSWWTVWTASATLKHNETGAAT